MCHAWPVSDSDGLSGIISATSELAVLPASTAAVSSTVSTVTFIIVSVVAVFVSNTVVGSRPERKLFSLTFFFRSKKNLIRD